MDNEKTWRPAEAQDVVEKILPWGGAVIVWQTFGRHARWRGAYVFKANLVVPEHFSTKEAAMHAAEYLANETHAPN